MIEIVAIILKILGVAFLAVAAIGVYRLPDPFMRMHAATKAGTLGAGLVALATALTATDWSTVVSALATIAVLLLTLPVASHLLGRATYVSGAAFDGAGVRDALAGVLRRQPVPLEERLTAPPGVAIADEGERAEPAGPAPGTAGPKAAAHLQDMFTATIRPRTLDQLLVAALDGLPPEIVLRCQRLARAEGIEPTLLAFLDQVLLSQAPDRTSRDEAAHEERARLAALVKRFEEAALPHPALAVQYAEGDPFSITSRLASPDGLMVVPLEGWFSHGIDLPAASYARAADGLLALADTYPGHVLFVPPDLKPVERVLAIDDGSTAFLANLTFAVQKGLWPDAEYVVTGVSETEAPTVRRLVIESVLNGTGCAWRFARAHETRAVLAPTATAACLHALEKPLRTNWYGSFWQDRIAPGWRGELLIG